MSPESLFNILSDPTRLRALMLIQSEGELCVCELTGALGAPQPTISRHLAHLREAGLVTDRRDGLWIHYRINPALPAWILEVLKATAAGNRGQQPFASDVAALESMPNRPGAPRCA